MLNNKVYTTKIISASIPPNLSLILNVGVNLTCRPLCLTVYLRITQKKELYDWQFYLKISED